MKNWHDYWETDLERTQATLVSLCQTLIMSGILLSSCVHLFLCFCLCVCTDMPLSTGVLTCFNILILIRMTDSGSEEDGSVTTRSSHTLS